MKFDHVKCSLQKSESAEPIIGSYLKTSSATVHAVNHVWFVNEIFPEFRDAFNTTVGNYNEFIKRLSNLEAKMLKLSVQNASCELSSLKMLVDKVAVLRSNLQILLHM